MKLIRCYYRDGKNLTAIDMDYFHDNYSSAIGFVKEHLKQNLAVLALVNK
jgi:hypothetical protein